MKVRCLFLSLTNRHLRMHREGKGQTGQAEDQDGKACAGQPMILCNLLDLVPISIWRSIPESGVQIYLGAITAYQVRLEKVNSI